MAAPAVCASCHGVCSGPAERDYCVVCRNLTCKRCVRCQFPNRLHAVVCQRCAPPPQPKFCCGRCRNAIPKLDFLCDMCVTPICYDCLEHSFEGGRLKCADCCDQPVATNIQRLPGAPQLITATLLKLLQVPLRSEEQPRLLVAPSKYNNLTRICQLGEGGQGVVYKCKTDDGEVVVSKELFFVSGSNAEFEAQRKQAERMRRLDHPHLIRYLDVIAERNPPKVSVIMPFYNEGDLSKLIQKLRAPLPEQKLLSLILQIAEALNYLHSQTPPLMHLDVKPDNVLLLNREEQVLLMDLDLCRTADVTASVISRSVDPTYEYRPPEWRGYESATPKNDIFSLGVVAYVLTVLPDYPASANDKGESVMICDASWKDAELERAIHRDMRRVSHAYTHSEDLVRLLTRMLLRDPNARPTAAGIIAMIQDLMMKVLTGT